MILILQHGGVRGGARIYDGKHQLFTPLLLISYNFPTPNLPYFLIVGRKPLPDPELNQIKIKSKVSFLGNEK